MRPTPYVDRAGAGEVTRRGFLKSAGVVAAASALLPFEALPSPTVMARPIPSTGELLPVIGLGSWITFNVGEDRAARDRCARVVGAFFESGGTLIDSSPMYGSAQSVIGDALARIRDARPFAADKVWIAGGSRGPAQIDESRGLWRIERFDLLQVHNLLSWEEHLPTLFAMKKEGRLRYVGITTSHGRRHGELESIMRREPLDFVQLTYNPVDRDVEERLLPTARDRGIAVIANRPFQTGVLLDRLERHPLPGLARELDADSWAQLVLKFIVSHPVITCAIPATSVVAHARENVAAARGTLPDAAMRRRIAEYIERL